MRNLIAAALLLAALPARASQLNTGNDTAQFLTLGAGARALGMGEAYGPVAEGPEALYWNPAGLAQLRSPETAYSHQELYSILHHEYLVHAQPVPFLRGVVAFSYTRLSQDTLTAVSNTNQTLGSFTPHSDAFSIGYAHAFDLRGGEGSDRDYFREAWDTPGTMRPFRESKDSLAGTLLVGFALKGVSEHIYDHSAHTVGLDGGLLFRPAFMPELGISAAFRNAFGQEKFDNENYLLPFEASAGVSYDQRWWDARLLPALEVVVPYFGNMYVKAGAEYSKPVGKDVTVSIRGGYKTLTASDLGVVSGLTGGVGMQVRHLTLDFGFEPMSDLGSMYRFTAGWKW